MTSGGIPAWALAALLFQSSSPSAPPSTPPAAIAPSGSAQGSGGAFQPRPAPAPGSSPAPASLPSTSPLRLGGSAPPASTPAGGVSIGSSGSSSAAPATAAPPTSSPGAGSLRATPPTNSSTPPASLPNSQGGGTFSAAAQGSSAAPPSSPQTSGPASPISTGSGSSGLPPSLRGNETPAQSPPTSSSGSVVPASPTAGSLSGRSLPFAPIQPSAAQPISAIPVSNPNASSTDLPQRPATLPSGLGASSQSTPPTSSAPPSNLGLPGSGQSSSTPSPTYQPTTNNDGARFAPPQGIGQTSSESGLPSGTLRNNGSTNNSGGLPTNPGSSSGGFSAPRSSTDDYPSASSNPGASGAMNGIPNAPLRSLPNSNQPLYSPSGVDSNSRFGSASAGATTRVIDANAPARLQTPEDPVGPDNPRATQYARDTVAGALSRFQQQEQLSGSPLPLVDAIARVSDVAGRKQMVKRYWTLTASALDLENARAESDFLAALRAPADSRQFATLQAAQAIARARRAEATLAYRMAQRDLVDSLQGDPRTEMPIPVDSPFIGRYRTNFKMYLAQGNVSRELETIDWSLPLVLETIHARSEALAALEQEMYEMRSRYDLGQVGIDELLRAQQSLRDQRMAFLVSVRDYNHAIAEYSISVSPSSLTPDTVVSMLVHSPTQSARRDVNTRRSATRSPNAMR